MTKKNEGVQIENGYTKIANELLEALWGEYGHDLTSAEFKIMLLIIRYTYGFSRKFHKFSVSYVSKKTGLNNRHVKRTLNEMIRKKLLIIYGENTNTEARVLGPNKNYWEWGVKKREVEHSRGGELEDTRGTTEHQVNYRTPGDLQDTRGTTGHHGGDLQDTRVVTCRTPLEGSYMSPMIYNNININNIEKDEVKETTGQEFEIKNGKDAVVYFAKKFEEKFNVKYSTNWGKDARLMKELLETYGPELLAKMINVFLSEDDDWADKAGRTVGVLKARANSLALKATKATQHSHPDLTDKEHVTFVANPAWNIPLRPARYK